MNKSTEKIEFKNTHIYPNVDWDKEIATENDLEQEEHAEKSGNYLIAMHQIIEQVNKNIDEAGGAEKLDNHLKANMMRMVEFFYCKFFYHHAMFYRDKKFLDLLENQKKYGERFEHPVTSVQNKFGKTEKSNIPIEKLEFLAKSLIESVKKRREESEPKDGGFDEAKAMFEKEGLVIERPIGLRKEGDRDTCCVVHDGIRYHIYLMKSNSHHGMRTQDSAKEEANDLRGLIEKYHSVVKLIHDKMKAELPGMENLWVMEGGGMQHQAFFGNENGYIAILYLGMKKSKARKTDLTLVFEGYEDEPKWQTYKDFKVDGVECRAFDKTNQFKRDLF